MHDNQFVDLSRFYIASDNELMIDILKGEINFLKSAWQNLLGRPLVTLSVKAANLGRCFLFTHQWIFKRFYCFTNFLSLLHKSIPKCRCKTVVNWLTADMIVIDMMVIDLIINSPFSHKPIRYATSVFNSNLDLWFFPLVLSIKLDFKVCSSVDIDLSFMLLHSRSKLYSFFVLYCFSFYLFFKIMVNVNGTGEYWKMSMQKRGVIGNFLRKLETLWFAIVVLSWNKSTIRIFHFRCPCINLHLVQKSHQFSKI